MKKIIATTFIFIFFYGCESFVENADSSVSYATDDEISSSENISFLVNGVLNDFSRAYGYVTLWADLLSDAMVNDGRVQGSTDVRGEYLDNGLYDPTVGTYAPPYQAVAQSWRSARSLQTKLDDMDIEADLKTEGYFTAYLYQGLSHYILGTYYGRGPSYPSDGGATLNESAFIQSSDLNSSALLYLDSAASYANDYQTKIIHSLMARIYLYGKDYTNASQHAALGLQDGDAPFYARPGLEDPWPNWYWYEAGNNRTRYTLASRFKHLLGEDFIDSNGNGMWDSTETFTDCAAVGADIGQGDGVYNSALEPEESARIKVSAAPMSPDTPYMRYYQTKYPDSDSPITVISWQENHLMLAELALEGQSVSVSALDAVNAVRTAHGISNLSEVNLSTLLHERDKELFCQGQRIIDQNRHSGVLNWHLGESTWRFLPIPLEEQLANPNYP